MSLKSIEMSEFVFLHDFGFNFRNLEFFSSQISHFNLTISDFNPIIFIRFLTFFFCKILTLFSEF